LIGVAPPPPGTILPLLVPSPYPWSPQLNGGEGLALGLFCFLGWCFAIEPKLWTLRRGWKKAFQYLWVSTFRNRTWWVAPLIAVLGSPLVVLVWNFAGPFWESLLSMLVGLAFGGALVWAVRIIGSSALGKEAMGFGDVTLMAMIGAFVGWQGTLVVFFLAPFAALGIAVAQWLITRRHDIAFGPYLCVGALYALLRWPDIWNRIGPIFILGWFIPGIVVICLVLMWLMLAGLRWLRGG
jgi:prepilin signal peptidase PulO-like enzyme (type II secretory pathway)